MYNVYEACERRVRKGQSASPVDTSPIDASFVPVYEGAEGTLSLSHGPVEETSDDEKLHLKEQADDQMISRIAWLIAVLPTS